MNKKIFIIIFLSILVIGLLLRIINISSDPLNIPFLDTRDEGLYSYASRNMALFGKWQSDNFSYARIMPVYPPLQLIGVKFLGIHSYAFRFINVFLSTATIIALFIFIRNNLNIYSAIVGMFLLSVNFMYLVFSRSGLPEITMIFFSLLSFIFWFNCLTVNKRVFLNSLLSSLFFMIAFFTKQSMVSLIGVYFLSCIYLIIKDRKRLKIVSIGFSIPVIAILLAYFCLFYSTNSKEWYSNYLATINIHRLRKTFISFSYISNQLHVFINNDYWKYSGILVVACFVFITTLLKGFLRSISLKLSPKNTLFFITSTWFLLIMAHMIFSPGKFGRFYVISIIPLIIMLTCLFNFIKGKIRYLFYGLFFIDIMLNCFNIYKYIILNPKFTYQAAVKELNQFVSKDDLVSLPPHWIMNASFKTINPFLIIPDDKQILNFYNTYGWPKYLAIIDYQVEMYRLKTPIYFSYLSPVKKINEYVIYKVARNVKP